MTQPNMEKRKAAIERLQSLRRLREQGAARFILLYGGVLCGGGMALFFAIAMSLIADAPFFKALGISLLAWPLLGLLFGAQMWWMLGRGLEKIDAMLVQQKNDQAHAEAAHSARLDQLAKLKQLHDSGAIDADDYERQRRALLDGH